MDRRKWADGVGKEMPSDYGIQFPNQNACAWGISLLLWPPWIYSWPYIEGQRTVPDNECYIQFIETNHYITFGTAIAAFYVPVTVMCFLYYRIWMETEKRQKDLPNLQAGKKDSSKRSNSSDEAVDLEDWKRARGEGGGAKTVSGSTEQGNMEYGVVLEPHHYHKAEGASLAGIKVPSCCCSY
uniref:G-protein coupled receptors family 1 profile domain-containing protein n=1 Tax=Rhodnius prolixus TaxID=13249 RepID=T1HCI7_RHOPR